MLDGWAVSDRGQRPARGAKPGLEFVQWTNSGLSGRSPGGVKRPPWGAGRALPGSHANRADRFAKHSVFTSCQFRYALNAWQPPDWGYYINQKSVNYT